MTGHSTRLGLGNQNQCKVFSEQKEYYGRLTELFIMEIWPQDSFKGIRQMCKKNKGNRPNLTSGGCPPVG